MMLKQGTAYVDAGQEYYEERYRSRVLQNLKRKAQELGFELVAMQRGTAIPWSQWSSMVGLSYSEGAVQCSMFNVQRSKLLGF